MTLDKKDLFYNYVLMVFFFSTPKLNPKVLFFYLSYWTPVLNLMSWKYFESDSLKLT